MNNLSIPNIAVDTKNWSLITSDLGKIFIWPYSYKRAFQKPVFNRFGYSYVDVFGDMIKEYGVKNIKAKELLALDLNICKTMGICF